jgi:hypothetical protein
MEGMQGMAHGENDRAGGERTSRPTMEVMPARPMKLKSMIAIPMYGMLFINVCFSLRRVRLGRGRFARNDVAGASHCCVWGKAGALWLLLLAPWTTRS